MPDPVLYFDCAAAGAIIGAVASLAIVRPDLLISKAKWLHAILRSALWRLRGRARPPLQLTKVHRLRRFSVISNPSASDDGWWRRRFRDPDIDVQTYVATDGSRLELHVNEARRGELAAFLRERERVYNMMLHEPDEDHDREDHPGDQLAAYAAGAAAATGVPIPIRRVGRAPANHCNSNCGQCGLSCIEAQRRWEDGQ